MKKLYAAALIAGLVMTAFALTGCSAAKYRIKEVKSEKSTNTYDYYEGGALKSIITTDEEGEETFRREFSEDGKLTKVESSAQYYPAMTIIGDLAYTRYDTQVGLEYDSDFYLRPDGQTKMKVQRYEDKTVTNIFIYDENGVCKGITTDQAGDEYFRLTYEYDYDSNGNPSKCYQVMDGEKTFVNDMIYEKY